jgi:non-heme chloroperoxidase
MFVHGMWLHSTSWQQWAERFEAAGYDPVLPEWPGVADTIAATRQNPDAQAGNELDEIGDHLTKFAAKLDSKPILIGHYSLVVDSGAAHLIEDSFAWLDKHGLH